VIIGGSKVATKLKLLNNLIEIFDTLIIGGAMANTFLLAQGFNIGKSLVETDLVNDAKQILNNSNYYKTKVILPVDLVVANSIEDKIDIKIVDVENFPPNQMAFDIGNQTIKLIKLSLLKSNIIFWNGPLGVFEHKPFDNGTNQVAKIIKDALQKLNITTIAGGGDTVAAINKTKAEKGFTYISTAGGAFLEWLEGKESPGLKALKNNKKS
jgi:phosphoglycerate kinase